MSDEDSMKAQLNELEQWFNGNDNLPEKIDRLLLQRFLQCMNFNLDDTKELIEINYRLRNKHSHIFLQRDPNDEDTRHTFEYIDMVTLPGLTREGYKVCCYRLCNYDASKVNHTADIKAFFMLSDCRLSIPDVEGSESLAVGEVQILDLAGYTMRHLTKINLNTQRIYLKFLQKAYPVRLKAVHLINCPSYLDKIIAAIRPFLNKDILKLVNPHIKGLQSLHEAIPREMLPEEYGGDAGKIDDLKSETMEILSKNSEYLMDPKYWKIEAMPK